ncbi:uncharacterized protein [Aegilops tauschii subsp. strangulata]|nr:uncharacterized protein LOC109741038 [Aegilops tauschii subsp. strangulata]
MAFVGMDPVFAAAESARVANQDPASEVSPDELDSDGDCSGGDGGSSGPPGTPAITSRLSLLKLGSVISKFSDFKKQLVREIGFDGLLHIKSWQKINLKYSAYLMDRVHVDNSVINLEGQGMLELTDESVHSVFAIPRGELAIGPEGVEPSEACIEYTRFAASINDKGTHSLKAAEAYLMRDIAANSRKIDMDCFKIAFVIFVIGHVLAPSAKHDYVTIDFWAALSDVDKIRTWNWCSYILKHLFNAVRKFKSDVIKRNPTIHIVGCHLFLQVFVLDSLELGQLNKPRGMYPRIALFEHESMKKMIDITSVNMGGGEISFHGASVKAEQNISKGIVCASTELANENIPRHSNTTKRVQMPSAPILRATYNKIGPQDFSNHIRTNYPSISDEKLGILLREHNARGLANISEMRRSFQSSMFTFADKLINCIAENCSCCKANGRKQCILKSENQNSCTNLANTPMQEKIDNSFVTPVCNKVSPRLAGQLPNDGSSSANSSIARNRGVVFSPAIQTESSKKVCLRLDDPLQAVSHSAVDTVNNSSLSGKQDTRREVANTIYSFFDDLTASIVMYYVEQRPSSGYVTFGTTNDTAPAKIQITKCNITRDPWAIGSVPMPPAVPVLRAIKDWLAVSSTFVLERKWIMHPKPRLILLDGIEIQQQLSGKEQLSHEMCAVIFRRLSQMDKTYSKDTLTMFWRKFLEPDFGTAVLSNADPLTIQSIRATFTEENEFFSPASSRMWHIPALLPDGWAVYAFDMAKRRILVLDPAVGPFGFSNRRINMHTYVSDLLHAALFRCIQSLYDSWHCSSGEWTRAFPVIMLENIEKEDYGVCASFFARNYDGDKL